MICFSDNATAAEFALLLLSDTSEGSSMTYQRSVDLYNSIVNPDIAAGKMYMQIAYAVTGFFAQRAHYKTLKDTVLMLETRHEYVEIISVNKDSVTVLFDGLYGEIIRIEDECGLRWVVRT